MYPEYNTTHAVAVVGLIYSLGLLLLLYFVLACEIEWYFMSIAMRCVLIRVTVFVGEFLVPWVLNIDAEFEILFPPKKSWLKNIYIWIRLINKDIQNREAI